MQSDHHRSLRQAQTLREAQRTQREGTMGFAEPTGAIINSAMEVHRVLKDGIRRRVLGLEE